MTRRAPKSSLAKFRHRLRSESNPGHEKLSLVPLLLLSCIAHAALAHSKPAPPADSSACKPAQAATPSTKTDEASNKANAAEAVIAVEHFGNAIAAGDIEKAGSFLEANLYPGNSIFFRKGLIERETWPTWTKTKNPSARRLVQGLKKRDRMPRLLRHRPGKRKHGARRNWSTPARPAIP